MIPPYTFVYPLKAINEIEAPVLAGQRCAQRRVGDTRDGNFGSNRQDGLGALGGLVPLAFAVYYGCKNGLLPASACTTIDVVPGKTMPGSCPDAYKMDGACYCPAGSETADGGCVYPGAYTVGPEGALPIGSGSGGLGPALEVPAATDSSDAATTWVVVGGLAALVALVLVQKKR